MQCVAAFEVYKSLNDAEWLALERELQQSVVGSVCMVSRDWSSAWIPLALAAMSACSRSGWRCHAEACLVWDWFRCRLLLPGLWCFAVSLECVAPLWPCLRCLRARCAIVMQLSSRRHAEHLCQEAVGLRTKQAELPGAQLGQLRHL